MLNQPLGGNEMPLKNVQSTETVYLSVFAQYPFMRLELL